MGTTLRDSTSPDMCQHLSLQNDSRHDTVVAMCKLGCFVVQLFDHAMS